jgi:uncharacterized membrane protein
MRKISVEQVRAAVERAGLPPEVFNRIEAALKAEPETSASFEAAHISYYLGALLIIGAMGWFITNGWDRLSGLTIAGIALVYAVLFGVVGCGYSARHRLAFPGGY